MSLSFNDNLHMFFCRLPKYMFLFFLGLRQISQSLQYCSQVESKSCKPFKDGDRSAVSSAYRSAAMKVASNFQTGKDGDEIIYVDGVDG